MATNSARAINVHDSRVIPAPQALRSSRYKRGSARRDSLIRWLEHTGTGRFSDIHRALFVRVSHMRVPSASERTSYSEAKRTMEITVRLVNRCNVQFTPRNGARCSRKGPLRRCASRLILKPPSASGVGRYRGDTF